MDEITRKIYSDHNGMSSVMKWVQEENTQKNKKKVMTNQVYIKYRDMLQNGKVRFFLGNVNNSPQQTRYDRWSDKIIEIKMKCERRQRKQENNRFKKDEKEDAKQSRSTN